MQHLCSALTLMHAHHVVHHDIHDGNIRWDSVTHTFRLIDLDSVADVDPTRQRSKRAKALAQDMDNIDVWDAVKMYKEMVYWTCLPTSVYAAYPSDEDDGGIDLDRVVLEAPASSLTAASWKKRCTRRVCHLKYAPCRRILARWKRSMAVPRRALKTPLPFLLHTLRPSLASCRWCR